MKTWGTLGYFDNRGDGQIIELDAGTGTSRQVLAFDPPPGLVVPKKGFTGATWTAAAGKGDLLVCGSAAVYRFHGTSLDLVGTLTQPSFNDLHGVTVAGDRIYVVNTGLDCIDTFDLAGRFLGSLSFDAPWLLASRQTGDVPNRLARPRAHIHP